ncbi:tetratricopeptide repeat protein [Nitrosomonas sp.]|uniref:tetratricopeptide repeat protein n=1 Tax=Nitrosomonas sp. TaxID=42353 RepID=UPI00345DE826
MTYSYAKEGILWNLIDQDDKRSLQTYIKTWREAASENQSLWGVYGIALGCLGRLSGGYHRISIQIVVFKEMQAVLIRIALTTHP